MTILVLGMRNAMPMKEHILLGIRSCLNKTSPYHHLHKIFSLLLSFSERDDGGWDGWMASSTQWMWVWVNSRSWWWTGRHGVLRFMGSQRVGQDWVTELNWTALVLFRDFSLKPFQSWVRNQESEALETSLWSHSIMVLDELTER